MDAVEEIRQLKYRYARTLDTKRWDEFLDTLTPDVSAEYGSDLRFTTRDALVDYMRGHLGADRTPLLITEHHVGHPEITMDGDTARGTWYLSDTVIAPARSWMLRGAAFYSDQYLRCDDGRWRIAHTGYERIYEAVWSLPQAPDFHFDSPWSESPSRA